MNKTIKESHQQQSQPLSLKIQMTQQKIKDVANEYNKDRVYVTPKGITYEQAHDRRITPISILAFIN